MKKLSPLILTFFILVNVFFIPRVSAEESISSKIQVMLTDSSTVQWSKNDRESFENDLDNLKKNRITIKKIYLDYKHLAKSKILIDKQAYIGKKGYILYSPNVSERFNAVWSAEQARAHVVADYIEGGINAIKSVDNYYPKDQWVRYFPDSLIGEVYTEVDGSPQSIGINGYVYTKYINYDQDKVVDFLDTLPISDYYLKGQTIHFLNSHTPTSSGFNIDTNVRGFYEGYITLLANNTDMEETIDTLAHEIGHNVESEIFNKFVKKISQNMREYASIYGKTDEDIVFTGNWKDLFYENFAEDFKYMVTGENKFTDWKGNENEAISFIKSKMESLKEDQAKQFNFQRMFIDLGRGKETWHPAYGDFGSDVYLTDRKELKISFEDLSTGDYELDIVIEYPSTTWKRLRLNKDKEVIATLKDTGKYKIYIGTLDNDGLSNSIISLDVYKM